MSEVVRELDSAGDADVPLPEIVTDIDLASMTYMAEQRALRAQQLLASMNPPLARIFHEKL
jgi:hypothetical protein